MTEKEKTDELLDLIDALCDVNFSKSQAVVDAWVSRLNKVYSNEYRHTYCFTVDLIEMLRQLTGRFQIDIGRSAVLFQILEPHTAKASISCWFFLG